ncbi:MAG: flagellar biosynthesis anti-sigma factor FlgM [Gemmataceae bacterium]|nr:flagellar biosynthesis anti-sigma factor FlgM [Gemmataceae bacterium]
MISHRDDASKVPSISDPDVRTDLVKRVRAQIAAGTYDTPERWEAALDRLLTRLDRE